jgi:hypothetical protein
VADTTESEFNVKLFRSICVIFNSVIASSVTFGFEIDTHARITQEAFKASRLYTGTVKNPLLSAQGLYLSRARVESPRSAFEIPLGSRFIDMTNPASIRIADRYDHRYGIDAGVMLNRWERIVEYKKVATPFLADWLSRGSISSRLALPRRSARR